MELGQVEKRCGVYLGVVKGDDWVPDQFKDVDRDNLVVLVIRKPLSLYDSRLVTTFLGVRYDKPKERWVSATRDPRDAIEARTSSPAAEEDPWANGTNNFGLFARFMHYHLLWDFSESRKEAEAKLMVRTHPSLAHLDIFEEAAAGHMARLLGQKNQVDQASFFTSTSGLRCLPHPAALIASTLRHAFAQVGVQRPKAPAATVAAPQKGWFSKAISPAPLLAQAPAPAQRGRAYHAVEKFPGKVPTVEELFSLSRELLSSHLFTDESVPGYDLVDMPDNLLGDLKGQPMAVARQTLRGWICKVDGPHATSAPALYREHLEQAAEAHTMAIATRAMVRNKPTTTQGTSEAFNYRALLKQGTSYVYGSVYGFRADTRPPCELRCLGGFQPNAVRGDKQAAIWVKDDEGRLGPNASLDMLDNFNHQANWGSDTSGYISVTHSLPPALQFASNITSIDPKSPVKSLEFSKRPAAYVYVVRARQAVDVTASFQTTRYEECEYSVAGGIGWPDILGWRKTVWFKDKLVWGGPLFLTSARFDSEGDELLPGPKRAQIEQLMSCRAEEVMRINSQGNRPNADTVLFEPTPSTVIKKSLKIGFRHGS